MPLNVVIDARGMSRTLTGVGYYTLELIKGLGALSEKEELSVRIFDGQSVSLTLSPTMETGIEKTPTFTATVEAVLSRYLPKPVVEQLKLARSTLRDAGEKNTLSREITGLSPLLLHGTNSVFYSDLAPTVVTIHDVSWITHPHMHPKSRVLWHEKKMPQVLQTAKRILTVSDFSKTEIERYLGVHPSMIDVTPNGVNANVFYPRELNQVDQVLSAYDLSQGKYVLAVGTIEPRKNIELLISVYDKLSEKFRAEYPLVLVGMKGWHSSSFFKTLERLQEKGHVRVLGYVPQNDLPALLQGARLFAFPSCYEGFGLPALEAMAMGTPVIASNTSSIPEVVGDAGLLLDPYEEEQWVSVLTSLLVDGDQLQIMRVAGLERSKHFTWESCAAKTLKSYRHALNAL